MALAWLLKNWKLALSGLALVVMVGLYFYVGHLRETARAQKARANSAVAQAKVQAVATKAVDQVAQTTARVEERTHVVIRTIHEAPGADTPVDPALLSVWRDGLRDGSDDPPH